MQNINGLELNKIHQGDCLELMKLIPDNSIDLILTDPPYGTTACKWDSVISIKPMWSEVSRVLKENGAAIFTAQTPFDKVLGASNLPMLKYELIWEKTSATGFLNAKKMPLKAHENILVFYDKLPTYNPQKTQRHKPSHSYTKKKNSDGECYGDTKGVKGGGNTDRYPRSVMVFKSDKQVLSLHPTQKPIALLEYLIKTYTQETELVLDFTIGSGSTAIACLNTNRNFIGIELEREYVDIANKRISEIQQKLF